MIRVYSLMGFHFADFFDTFYFLLAFCIGLFAVYLTTPVPEIYIKYPTPDNAHQLVFQDKSDTCYQYIPTEVTCPSDNSTVDLNDELKQNGNEKSTKKSWFGI